MSLKVDLKRKTGFPLLWSGCIVLVFFAALHSANCKIGGGDTWVAMQNGRFTVADDWATRHPGRTWQMRLLDKFGIHMTKKDPFSAASRFPMV